MHGIIRWTLEFPPVTKVVNIILVLCGSKTLKFTLYWLLQLGSDTDVEETIIGHEVVVVLEPHYCSSVIKSIF